MSALALIAICGFSFGVGVLIGGVGVGGVLLVPALVYLGGVDIHIAIAAAMFGYLFTGIVGAAMYARRGSIRWPLAGWLCIGAMPAAFAGAWAANTIPKSALELVIAGFAIFAGVNALRPGDRAGKTENGLGGPSLTAIGAVTGFASAITGTGGPLVLVPTLLWLRFPVLAAVGLSQAVQLPIAALATAGNVAYGRLDLELGGAIAVGLAAGAATGALAAHRIPQPVLRLIVALVLIAVGLYIGVKIAYFATQGISGLT